tara:strand:+ start:560 stop:1144 length:585 start_codon:yes stop_codon:yes gene_type:complete
LNFLAHLALSGKSQNLTIGNFLGDFVKGNLISQYDKEVELGIKFHRAIDAYTDHHLLIKLSKNRFGPRFRRIGGIMVDIAYDHLLALSWDKFYDEPIDRFSKRVLEDVLAFKELPWEAENLAKMMLRKNSLEKYKNEEFLNNASLSIHKRLNNRTPMLEAPEVIKNVKAELGRDFVSFYPQLIDFSAEWLQEND